MKAIVNTGPGELSWLERPTPEPDPGQVRIKTSACAICATDLRMIGSNAGTGAWVKAVEPAINGVLPLGQLITHRVPAPQFERAVDLARGTGDHVLKVILQWQS